jgi:hypothetical protein
MRNGAPEGKTVCVRRGQHISHRYKIVKLETVTERAAVPISPSLLKVFQFQKDSRLLTKILVCSDAA